MVAAKLDQSRVLVTKFRQNRLALKGRSAGQRQTDRQTDKLGGLQSGQQIDTTHEISRTVNTSTLKNIARRFLPYFRQVRHWLSCLD